MYTEWRDACNKNPDLALIQADLNDLSTLTKRNLSYALYRFVTEIKKLDGSDYPLHTLYRIVIGIQMYLETQGVNWQLTNDPEFKNVHFTVDNVMKHCTSQGLGTIVNQAQILSYDQEELLWQQWLLGMSNPEQLLHTVVFTLGLYLALHTGKEHRALHSPGFNSQIQIVHAGHETHLEYAEDIGLKTNKGGLCQCKFQMKHVPIYPIANKSRCLVNVFLTYIGKLNPKRTCPALYLHPKKLYTPTD